MSTPSVLKRAGRWFLHSGIQEAGGGVARYYRSDLERNQSVSTEITGYAVSTLVYLGAVTGEPEYQQRAAAAARFLAREAWDGRAMPFESEPAPDGRFTYFFDCGIIVRGLLASWRAGCGDEFRDVAIAIGRAMAADFVSPHGEFHPILSLPSKKALAHDPLRWSQSPGCYQLKAALGWRELYEATGAAPFETWYRSLVDRALQGYAAFLPGHSDPLKVVDRLHAFVYFLEGLLPLTGEKRCAAALCDGIRRVDQYLQETAGQFERSDVYAQLLRIRLFADWAGVTPLDSDAAEREAESLAGFQASSGDSRVDGGFYFGRKGGTILPYVNPVSTAFALQALACWEQYQTGGAPLHRDALI